MAAVVVPGFLAAGVWAFGVAGAVFDGGGCVDGAEDCCARLGPQSSVALKESASVLVVFDILKLSH